MMVTMNFTVDLKKSEKAMGKSLEYLMVITRYGQ
jgi:hypothetical protein